MDFTIYNVGGIDYSPAPWITRITLVLEEPELRNAQNYQFERFWRVWHGERNINAPKLCELTLVLRAGYNDGIMELAGINMFLDYYRAHIEPTCDTKGLHVYLDSYSAIIDNTQYNVLDAPLLLFTVAQPQVYDGAEWPILPLSAFRPLTATAVSSRVEDKTFI